MLKFRFTWSLFRGSVKAATSELQPWKSVSLAVVPLSWLYLVWSWKTIAVLVPAKFACHENQTVFLFLCFPSCIMPSLKDKPSVWNPAVEQPGKREWAGPRWSPVLLDAQCLRKVSPFPHYTPSNCLACSLFLWCMNTICSDLEKWRAHVTLNANTGRKPMLMFRYVTFISYTVREMFPVNTSAILRIPDWTHWSLVIAL